MRTKSTPLKETREVENKDQTARKRLENVRTRNKPFEKAYSVWSHGANLSKEVGEFENKEQTAQKGQETFRNSSKPLQTAKREEEKLKERSKPLEYLKTKNTPLEKDQ